MITLIISFFGTILALTLFCYVIAGLLTVVIKVLEKLE
jgi:hypothetical protein